MEDRIDCAGDQRPQDQGEADKRDRRRGADQIQRLVIHSQDRPEQEALQRNGRAGGGQDKDAERQRNQIERGKARILADDREPCQQVGQQRHRDAGRKPANDHRGDGQSGDHKADHDPGHDGVGHCLAGKRQAPQHQKGPDRRDGKAEHAGRGKGAEHEFILKPLKHRRPPTGCRHPG